MHDGSRDLLSDQENDIIAQYPYSSFTDNEEFLSRSRASSITEIPIHRLLEALRIRGNLGGTESVFTQRPNLHLS